MKNVILTVITMFVTIGFSGCTPALLDGVNPEGKNYNGAYNKEVDSMQGWDLRIFTTEGNNPKEKFDILVKNAAIEYQKRGVEYFSVSQGSPLITNYKDTIDYCYPNSFGLEKKCAGLDNEKLILQFRGEVVNYFKPQWSVKEVLATMTPQDKILILKEVNAKDLYKIK